MIQTLNAYDFVNAFRAYGRQDQFSSEGLHLLFDYLEEIDPSWELDVVGLCCDYYEDTAMSIAKENDIEVTEDDSDEDVMQKVMDYLNDNTSVVGVTHNSIVYAAF